MRRIIIRIILGLFLTAFVVIETGPWTGAAIAFLLIRAELVDYSIYRFYKSIRDAAEGDA
jgi:hypothetical protein